MFGEEVVARRVAADVTDHHHPAAQLQSGLHRIGEAGVVHGATTAATIVASLFALAVASLSAPDRLEEIEWSKAVVGFGLSDPRGIVSVDGFDFNGHEGQPRPGTALDEILPRGFHVTVGHAIADDL